jgi:hypothetical protein
VRDSRIDITSSKILQSDTTALRSSQSIGRIVFTVTHKHYADAENKYVRFQVLTVASMKTIAF